MLHVSTYGAALNDARMHDAPWMEEDLSRQMRSVIQGFKRRSLILSTIMFVFFFSLRFFRWYVHTRTMDEKNP